MNNIREEQNIQDQELLKMTTKLYTEGKIRGFQIGVDRFNRLTINAEGFESTSPFHSVNMMDLKRYNLGLI